MMILRSLLPRPQAIAAATAGASRTTPSLARSLYTVPTLANGIELQQRGVSGLLTPKAFDIAYTQYQQHLVDALNDFTADTAWENQDTKSLVLEFARDPTRAYGFNIASMAFNNHFFFRGLNTQPDVHSQPSRDLDMAITRHFSSRDTLRATFLDTAEAMFGPGFVWLVQTADSEYGPLRVLPTYLAGSPLSGAHYRRQSHDLNTHNPDSYQALNPVGTFGPAARQKQPPKTKPLGGIDVVPLLCVSTWEHVWLQDYGFKVENGIPGKRQYLEAWWDKIDWDIVSQNASLPSSQGQPAQRKFAYT